jgi:hypothetical protein
MLISQQFAQFLNKKDKQQKLATIQIIHSLVNIFSVHSIADKNALPNKTKQSPPLITEINKSDTKPHLDKNEKPLSNKLSDIPKIVSSSIPRILTLSQFVPSLVQCATVHR